MVPIGSTRLLAFSRTDRFDLRGDWPAMSAGRWTAARLALGTTSALGLGRFSYGLVLPAMAEDQRWSLADAGAMTTANGLGYLAGALATAAVVRRFGVATTFRAGMVLCAATLGATAVGSNYAALLAARAVTGFAGALVFIAGAVLAPGVVYFAGTGLGIALSAVAVPPLLDRHPERWPLAWVVLAGAAALAVMVTWTAAGQAPAVPVQSGGRLLRPLWAVAAAYLLFAAGYIAYITYLSAYLVAQDASSVQTALTWILLGVAVTAAPIVWRRPIARRPGGRTLAVLLAVLAVAALGALIRPDPWVVGLSAIGYGGTFMAVPAAVTALVREATTPDRLTATVAAFTVIFAAGQTAGPWLAGAIADRTAPGATLGWTALLCGGGAVLAALHRSRAPDPNAPLRPAGRCGRRHPPSPGRAAGGSVPLP
jgi:predicted MFS family arabinose efflux permease